MTDLPRTSKDMHIITGSDNNYVPGVMVLIASASFHNPQARFTVLDMGITAENRTRIDGLASFLGVEINRIEVDSSCFDHLIVQRSHLTRSTYLRLLIPALFPKDDRAIYMDCDMVVMGELTALAAVDLSNYIVAGVPCPSPDPVELEATGRPLGSYINAGLLVMNLPLWRSNNVAEACIRLLSDPANPLLSEDQSAINIVGKDSTLLTDPTFNVYSDPSSYKRAADFPDAPIVLHYVVNNKPWKGPTNLGSIWEFHAERIDAFMPYRPPALRQWRRHISIINRRRKLWLGLLTRSQKYVAQQQVRRKMRDIGAAYLSGVRETSK